MAAVKWADCGFSVRKRKKRIINYRCDYRYEAAIRSVFRLFRAATATAPLPHVVARTRRPSHRCHRRAGRGSGFEQAADPAPADPDLVVRDTSMRNRRFAMQLP